MPFSIPHSVPWTIGESGAQPSATLDLPAANTVWDPAELVHCRSTVTPEGKTTSGVQMWKDDGGGYASWFALADDGVAPDDTAGDDVWNGEEALDA